MDSRLKTNPKFLFECYVELDRPNDGEEPRVKYHFPKDYQFDEDTRKQLPKFVFPNRYCHTDAEEHFTFVLTDLDGKFRFGFCRYPAKGDTCMCFLSDLPWFKVFFRAMDKVADLKLNFQSEVLEPFLSGLRNHPLPQAVEELISVVPDGVDTGQVYTFPLPNTRKLPEIPTDSNFTAFYTSLHHQVILCLFANMLFERRIIVTSSSLTSLSACVHGCVLLLYPLFWQHIFIPITPQHLIDYCAAPMPFLMGVHSSMMEQVRRMPVNDVVILDIDNDEIESPYYEDLLQLPVDIVANLKHVLKKSSSAYGDTVTRAFMMAMVAMIGGYRSALKHREGQVEVHFDSDVFLKSRPNMEEFLGLLLHFQHFQQFINGRIYRLAARKDRDLFDEEALLHEEELRAKGFSSDQMKAAFQDIKEMSTKLGDVMKKRGRHAMKSTRTFFKGMIAISPAEYQTIPQSLASMKLDQPQQTHTVQRSSPNVPHHKKPPPVVPYSRHVEGKKKLVESLDAMYNDQERTSTTKRYSVEVPIGVLLSFSPPDTPPNDRSESASLCSKDSTDATNQPEVLTANLVDLGVSLREEEEEEKKEIPNQHGENLSDGDLTESDSVISSDSDPTGPSLHWADSNVLHNVHAESPPPIPPPRTKRHHPKAQPERPNLVIPHPQYGPRPSPFNDNFGNYSPSVAAALIKSTHHLGDSQSANTLSSTGIDLFKSLEPTTTASTTLQHPAPHLRASSGSPTTNLRTTQAFDRPLSAPPASEINDPWKPLPQSSASPLLSQRAKRLPPPLKPQPYDGSGAVAFMQSEPPPPAPSSQMDLLSELDLFGLQGMKGYTMNSDSVSSSTTS